MAGKWKRPSLACRAGTVARVRLRAPCLLLLALAVGLLAAGCPAPKRPLNVVLISVDTLRHDRLGYRGHPVPVSPNLDALAEESVVFTDAFSQAGWTLPSMATILTGRYPTEHGATNYHRHMEPTLPTLASILKEHGYHTRAYVSQVFLQPHYGFSKGFDHFDASVLETGAPCDVSTAQLLTDLALEGLEATQEPFFLWAHYFDPHFKYRRHPMWLEFGDAPVERYDQEIAYTDHQIGRVLERLRASGLMERTVVVLTADHGEEFGEHGGEQHYTVYDEVIRVPLMIRAPGLAAGQAHVRAAQIDLIPTILGLLELPTPQELPGRNLFGENLEARPVFVERDRPPGFRMRVIIDGDQKLVRIDEVDINTLPKPIRGTYTEVKNVRAGIYLYDRRSDPAEQHNLYSEDGARGTELLKKLADHFKDEVASPGEVEVDEEMQEQLRALGYL